MTELIDYEDVQDFLSSLNSIAKIADAITPVGAVGHDIHGGCIISLTEAMMGVSQSLQNIAEAINGFTDVVAEKQNERQMEVLNEIWRQRKAPDITDA